MSKPFTATWPKGWWGSSPTGHLYHWVRSCKLTDHHGHLVARCGKEVVKGSVRRSANGKPKCRRCVRLKG